MKAKTLTLLVAAAFAGASFGVAAQQAAKKSETKQTGKPMSFFVTSVNSGKGADLGGLDGADKYCQQLGDSAGGPKRVWRAYLSTTATGGAKVVNARDRIGKGPWYNAKGEMVAKNLDDLHTDPNINKETALTEKGGKVKVRGDTPNEHDIITGSDTHGRAIGGSADTTCSNYTSGAETGSVQVGHVDRAGLDDKPPSKSWNNSHASRGCSLPRLRSSGGGGLFYCFAAK
jgi:hypothetical protein